MTDIYRHFGFVACDGIPEELLTTDDLITQFVASDDVLISKEADDPKEAARVAGRCRKAAARAGARLNITQSGKHVYIGKTTC